MFYCFCFFLHCRFLFRSGNIETSADKFYNTTVEVQPANVSNRLCTSQFSSQVWRLDQPSAVSRLPPPVCTSLCVHVIKQAVTQKRKSIV